MDRILKLVYDNWYVNGDIEFPIANGMHPDAIASARQMLDYKSISNLDAARNEFTQRMLSSKPEAKFRNHDNFLNYYRRNNLQQHLIRVEQIVDDGSAYIYLLEIMTDLQSLYKKHETGSHTFYLHDMISPAALEHMKNGKLKIVISFAHDPVTQAVEIVNIEKYFHDLGIKGSNVIIIAGNDFKENPTKIRIIRGDLFTQQAAEKMLNYPHAGNLGYVSDNVKESDLDSSIVRKNKFICFNRQMNYRYHRPVLAYFALKHDLLQEGIFSFIGKIDDPLDSLLRLCDDDPRILGEFATRIRDMIPYEIDTQILDSSSKTNFNTDNNRKDLYLDTYLHIVSETRFEEGSSPFMSEKTFRPIVNLQPFLYFGNHHSLAHLRDLGFKTFHPFIDESYDDEINPKNRMLMLERELVKFHAMSINDIHDWYYSITDTLIHNQRHLATFKDTNPYNSVVEKLTREK
jgi:hypothetical protein